MNREQLLEQNAILKYKLKAKNGTSVINKLIGTSGFVCIAYFLHLSIKNLSGKETKVDAGLITSISTDINLITSLNGVNKYLLFALGMSIIVNVLLYKLYKVSSTSKDLAIENLHCDFEANEKRFDKNRTSSMLTKQGKTRTEDKV